MGANMEAKPMPKLIITPWKLAAKNKEMHANHVLPMCEIMRNHRTVVAKRGFAK